jgi:TP901 family phage tail tape measure protein
MVGEDAVIKIGADIKRAIAGIAAVEAGLTTLSAKVMTTAAAVRCGSMLMVGAFATVGAAAAGVATLGLATSIKTFQEYEQEVANAASVTGTMGQAFEDTKGNIVEISKTLGATTVFSAQEAASALYDVASMGYNVTDMAADDLEPILNLAAATQEDLTRTTEHVTASLGQFSLEMSDSLRVANVFAATISNSKATLEKIGLSMKYTGTIADQFGEDIETVSAALGIMYNNGLRGEQAGRSLRMSLGRLSDPTRKSRDVIEEMGLTVGDLNPELNSMTEIFHNLADANITTTQAMVLFGKEAAPGMMAVLKSIPKFEELEEKIRDSGGVAKDMAEKQLDTLHGSSILLKSAIENLKIEIGEKFGPTLIDVNMYLRDIVLTISDKLDPAFAKMDNALNYLMPSYKSLISIIGSLKGIFNDILDILPDGVSSFRGFANSINTVTDAMAGFFGWIDQHPEFTKFVAVIMSAVTAFSFLIAAINPVIMALGALLIAGKYFEDEWGSINDKIMSITDKVMEHIIEQYHNLIPTLLEIRDVIKDEVIPYMIDLFEQVKPAIGDLISSIGPVLNKIKNIISDLYPSFDNLKTIIVSIVGIFTDVIDVFSSGEIKSQAFTEAINKTTEIVAEFLKFIDEHPEITKFVAVIASAATIFTTLAPLINPVTVAIGALVLAGKYVMENWEEINSTITPLVSEITEFLISQFDKITEWWDENGTLIMEAVTVIFDHMWDNMQRLIGIFEWVWPYAEEIISSSINIILDTIKLAAQILTGDWEGAFDTLIDIGENASNIMKQSIKVFADKIIEIFVHIKDRIIENLTQAANDAKDWGGNLIDNFIDGIKSKYNDLKTTVADAASIVSDYIGFQSPTEEGPGRYVMDWGPNLVESFTDGIYDSMDMINGAFKNMSDPAVLNKDKGGNGSGYTSQDVYNIIVKENVIRDDADIDKIISGVEFSIAKKSRDVRL